MVNDDNWHHLVFTYDGNKKILYIDGKVDTQKDAVGKFGINGIDLTIGAAPGTRPALGLIDDVAIFNVAISSNDVKTIMDKGASKSLGFAVVSPAGRLTAIWAHIKSNR